MIELSPNDALALTYGLVGGAILGKLSKPSSGMAGSAWRGAAFGVAVAIWYRHKEPYSAFAPKTLAYKDINGMLSGTDSPYRSAVISMPSAGQFSTLTRYNPIPSYGATYVEQTQLYLRTGSKVKKQVKVIALFAGLAGLVWIGGKIVKQSDFI